MRAVRAGVADMVRAAVAEEVGAKTGGERVKEVVPLDVVVGQVAWEAAAAVVHVVGAVGAAAAAMARALEHGKPISPRSSRQTAVT